MEEQYVVFELAKEEYGINIISVQEIIRPPDMIKLPNSPPYILGIINLRGSIIPIVDLKKRLGLATSESKEETRVIIVKIENHSYGIIVDMVNEVLRIIDDQIEDAEDIYHGIDRDFINSVARIGERLIILLQLPAEI